MQEKPDQPGEIRHYRRLANKIIRSHFGEPASRIVYRSSGLTNYVFVVNHVQGQFVIRISPDREKLAVFKKELWATEKVRKAGVPSPEVLAVGNDVISEPYMISRRVTGTEASHHPKRKRIVHQMGEYAAIINSIPTEGFGANFDWTDSGPKYLTWDDYLHAEFQLDERLDFFATEKILSKTDLDTLTQILEDTKTKRIKPSLNHGDLRLKNVIVDDDGEVAAIVDWEECLSTLAPHWELSIALHDLSIDEKHILLEGYGMDGSTFEQMAPLITAFNIVNYYGPIRAAVEQGDEKTVAQFKLRLRGSLDLYSLPAQGRGATAVF